MRVDQCPGLLPHLRVRPTIGSSSRTCLVCRTGAPHDGRAPDTCRPRAGSTRVAWRRSEKVRDPQGPLDRIAAITRPIRSRAVKTSRVCSTVERHVEGSRAPGRRRTGHEAARLPGKRGAEDSSSPSSAIASAAGAASSSTAGPRSARAAPRTSPRAHRIEVLHRYGRPVAFRYGPDRFQVRPPCHQHADAVTAGLCSTDGEPGEPARRRAPASA